MTGPGLAHKGGRTRPVLKLALFSAAFLSLAAATLMFIGQRQFIYDPSHRAPSPAEAGFAGVTEVPLTTADGTDIVLWYVPPPHPGAPVILFFHGKGGEMADRPMRWAAYRAAGLDVAFLSYRGYGPSQGHPSESGQQLDATAASDGLTTPLPAPRIAVDGESLGTGPAVWLAANRPVGALILEAPYTALDDLAADHFPWLPVRFLLRDHFRSIDRIRSVTAPLLVLHGDAVSRVPLRYGKALFDAAPGSKDMIVLPGVGHIDICNPPTWALETAFLARASPS